MVCGSIGPKGQKKSVYEGMQPQLTVGQFRVEESYMGQRMLVWHWEWVPVASSLFRCLFHTISQVYKMCWAFFIPLEHARLEFWHGWSFGQCFRGHKGDLSYVPPKSRYWWVGGTPRGTQKSQNFDFSGLNSFTVGLNISSMSNLRVLNASVHYLHKK